MVDNITIAVDAMGGDFGPPVIVPASMQALAACDQLHLILVGDQHAIQKELNSQRITETVNSRLTIRHTTQKVEMDEPPAHALRTKKDSSMRVAVNLVKEGKAQACVSAGNTGALMATARFVLKTLPGIERPAIVSAFPTIAGTKTMRMLDLGANVDTSAEHLFQFAVMGSVLTTALDGIEKPKVYLLNIGHEDIKGNEQVKQTANLLASSTGINYVGYIEGDQIFNGEADVIICDGFVGNVALKTTEGVAVFIGKILKEEFYRNWFTKIVGLIAKPILKAVVKRIDPDRYNGATMLGLQGIVIKSHGGAKLHSFARAINEAVNQAEKNVPELIKNKVSQLLNHSTGEK